MEIINKFIDSHSRKLGYLSLGLSALYTAKTLLRVTNFLLQFGLSGYNLIDRYGKGSYALVTACTDGIGKGFAQELARRGFNLVMLVRNQEKAQQLADEIKETINKDIDIKIVVIDFLASSNLEVINNVFEQIKHLDISLLVNNAGMAIKTFSFELIPQQQLVDIISMNIFTQVLLTHKLIPLLRSRKNRKSGIINLSSQSADWGVPGFVMYGATKIFNNYFSEALTEEYKGEIDVMSLRPGWVNTPMTKGFKKHLEITPEECANAALNQLGRVMTTSGHWKHRLSSFTQGVKKSGINIKCRHLTKQHREAKV